MTEVKLWDIECNGSFYSMNAYISDGELTLSGNDFGKDVAAVWGSEEYEYRYNFDKENTDKLFHELAAVKDTSVDQGRLHALADWIGKDETEKRLIKFCDEKGIQYGFSSYSS